MHRPQTIWYGCRVVPGTGGSPRCLTSLSPRSVADPVALPRTKGRSRRRAPNVRSDGRSRRCGEMADALDLKSKGPLKGRAGSSPAIGTTSRPACVPGRFRDPLLVDGSFLMSGSPAGTRGADHGMFLEHMIVRSPQTRSLSTSPRKASFQSTVCVGARVSPMQEVTTHETCRNQSAPPKRLEVTQRGGAGCAKSELHICGGQRLRPCTHAARLPPPA